MTSPKPVALVTGAATGIGKAAALALTDAGFDVVGTSRKAATPSSSTVDMIALDVTDDASVTAAVADVLSRYGRIDVLVNNAGVGSTGAAEDSTISQDLRALDVNVLGTIRMMKAVLPHMRARRSGRIVNISSIVGFIPLPYMAIYAASKHAIEGYSWSVDHEVREFGIRVLLVEPPWVKTGFDANAIQPDAPQGAYDERRAIAEKVIADGVDNGADPADVAKAIVAAATQSNPKLRHPVGQAGMVAKLRRFAPERSFDKQMRKLNKLAS
ncbi:short-chain dehydrogenase/reductase [Rhodococcus sp. 06-412-2C]|uniref:oxidoreductase n=1 Tax=unclassified Rhodococcus (in: high G+C Gram-positive bacteria) TaxID=192944 RepID=UPI000B9B62B5|nr:MULTISPECIES: oxidoreductase [unclassified Rhodococcus (in: high G+C Gram-positive bacteria)]OZC83949.1 short-chain dehydrogenase/reductase [Rhodococcus sp. 06-412-2C]OZC94137.1 short-chain dehydrogenase/reductase [Rhodococcus sp. 06-412-2B]